MLPKVTLRATDGIGGTIHASKSGKAYTHDADGYVVVDHEDVIDLLATHERVPTERVERTAADPQVTSDSATSTKEGASALDSGDRIRNTRAVEARDGQTGQDHGGATPPYSPAQDDASTAATRADAEAEVEAAERSGVDAEHRSAQPGTGHMGEAHANADDQDAARG